MNQIEHRGDHWVGSEWGNHSGTQLAGKYECEGERWEDLREGWVGVRSPRAVNIRVSSLYSM